MNRNYRLNEYGAFTRQVLTGIRSTMGDGAFSRMVMNRIIITCLDFAAKKHTLKKRHYKELLREIHGNIILRMAAMYMPEAFDENPPERLKQA